MGIMCVCQGVVGVGRGRWGVWGARGGRCRGVGKVRACWQFGMVGGVGGNVRGGWGGSRGGW